MPPRRPFTRILVLTVFCVVLFLFTSRPATTERVSAITQNLSNGQIAKAVAAAGASSQQQAQGQQPEFPLQETTKEILRLPVTPPTAEIKEEKLTEGSVPKDQPAPAPGPAPAPAPEPAPAHEPAPVPVPAPALEIPVPVLEPASALDPALDPALNPTPEIVTTPSQEVVPSSAPKPSLIPPKIISARPDCTINSTRLRALYEKYDLHDNVEYGQRFINIRRENIERKTLTRVNANLFPEDFELIDIQNPPLESKCYEPLDLAVPLSKYPKTVDASDLLFGISTTYKRLYDAEISPIKEWAHWLTNGQGKSNGAGLILRLVDASDVQINSTREMLRALGMDVQVFHSNSSIQMAERYLSLLPALYKDATTKKHRKWLVMCDDDTFFPSMHSLLERLATYNHKSDLYIGTFSEDVNNIQRHGSQAFGGAGVFFTMHLASVVNDYYDDCSTPEKVEESNTGWGPQGDILLRKCIYENTEVRLTLLPALHQLDIMGDPAGFYESGNAPLSLHHFKGGIWHKAKPYPGSKIIHSCGEACFLQRFLFKDDFVVSNGYSVAYYPKGIQFDINQMERTFTSAPDDYGWNLDFMMGPGRQSLAKTGRKVAWDLEESVKEPNGSIRQIYIRRANDERWVEAKDADGNDGKPMYVYDGLLELVWVP